MTRRSSTAIRIRHKTNPTVDDTDYHGSQYDPRILRVALASAETGDYVITLTPEDTAIAALEIEYAGTGGDEPTAADGLADAADVLAATSPGWDFLTPNSSNSTSTLLLAIHPSAPQHTPSFDPPGSATMTPDHTGTMPIVAWGDGAKNLEIKVLAVDSGDLVLAPGSGTVDMQLLSIVDRTQPRGQNGPDNEDAGPAIVLLRSVTAQPLSEPWVVPCPSGWYTVRVSSDSSLPGGTVALDVWADKTDAPVSTIYSEDIAAGAVGTDELAADAVTGAKIADDAVDSEHVADGAIDPVHLASGGRANTVDTAVVLDAADNHTEVTFSSTAGAGTRTITRGTLPVGGFVFVRMTAYNTNAYTAAVLGGTVTFDAAAERAILMWNGTNLVHYALVGATFA